MAWTTPAVAYLILAIVGGAFIEASIHLTASALSFRMITTQAISGAIDQLLSTLGGYPQKIFPLGFQLGLTFLFPLAFIAYFPAAGAPRSRVTSSRSRMARRPQPVVGVILLLLPVRVLAWPDPPLRQHGPLTPRSCAEPAGPSMVEVCWASEISRAVAAARSIASSLGPDGRRGDRAAQLEQAHAAAAAV